MKKHVLVTVISCSILFTKTITAQITENVHQAGALPELLTPEIKQIVSKNVAGKQFVFLGEWYHYSNTDMVGKAAFVKYLIEEEGFTDIIFESDFYALYLDHDKRNLYGLWPRNQKCDSIFDFLAAKKIPIWGMDVKPHSRYTLKNFGTQMQDSLKLQNLSADARYWQITDSIIKNSFDYPKTVTPDDLAYYDSTTVRLLRNLDSNALPFTYQALKNMAEAKKAYGIGVNFKGVTIRDAQMADNLDFLSKQFPEKRFIVWAANSHIAKTESEFMEKASMGYKFLKVNKNNSYHIAFSCINFPKRSKGKILRSKKSAHSLYYYLPDLTHNYFLDAKAVAEQYPDIATQEYYAILWRASKKGLKTSWLQLFDAIIFIENGSIGKLR